MGLFDIFKKTKNNTQQILADFEKRLSIHSDKDYPTEYWFDIVEERGNLMKSNELYDYDDKKVFKVGVGLTEYTESDKELHRQKIWTWMHCDEYENKYASIDSKEAVASIAFRIGQYGFIYETINDTIHQLELIPNVDSKILDKFKWNRLSAAASLYGSIKFGLKIGLTKTDVKTFYRQFVYNEELINGTNATDTFMKKHNLNQEDLEKLKKEVEEKTGVDVDNIPAINKEIPRRKFSCLSNLNIEIRYAAFFTILLIAQSDEVSPEEHAVLKDIILELKIDYLSFNERKMDGDQACNLLQHLDEINKLELSRYIALIVGADGEFSGQEMMYVNDLINEIGLDDKLIIELTEKYWK